MRPVCGFIAISGALLAFPFLATPQGVTSDPSAPKPKFDVASVKERKPDQPKGQVPPFRTFPGGLSMGCSSLKTLIQLAYDVFASGRADILNTGTPSMPIEGLPDWVNSVRYSIDARTDSPQSAAMMRGPMMQALLEERFDLKVHREKREGPVYLLTVGKGPLKLHETQEGTCVPFDFSDGLNATPDHPTLCVVPTIHRRDPLMIWEAHGITLGAFAKTLHLDGRPVIDNTGLNGAFDIRYEWGPDVPDQPDTATAATGVASDPSRGAASFLVALREQLGLELKSGRGISEFLIIDHIGKAQEN
jgi:uncharacterized protein (TIGR03435 family)